MLCNDALLIHLHAVRHACWFDDLLDCVSSVNAICNLNRQIAAATSHLSHHVHSPDTSQVHDEGDHMTTH